MRTGLKYPYTHWHVPVYLTYLAEATQGLQGRRRLRDRGVAADSSSFHFVPDFRSASLGDEGFCQCSRSWVSSRADSGVGIRADPGRNQAVRRNFAARARDAENWQMDRDYCCRRPPRGCAARVSICANKKTSECRTGKTNRANCNTGQISRRFAIRKFELGQGERVFRAGYSG